VTTDLNTLLTAPYVKIDDHLGRRIRTGRPQSCPTPSCSASPWRRSCSEARWLRFVPRHLPGAFRYQPGQSGYSKRLRSAVPLIKRLIRVLAAATDLWTDPVWGQWPRPVMKYSSAATTAAGASRGSRCPLPGTMSKRAWGM
jgi:hypothetical protein